MKNQRWWVGLAFYLAAWPGYGEQTVALTGELKSGACALACGICCGEALLSEANGGFQTWVLGSEPDLKPFLDDGIQRRITGFFFQGTGQCGVNACTYFHVSSIETATPDQATFDSSSQTLHVPDVLVDDQARWAVTLTTPCTVLDAQRLPSPVIADQGEDCSGAGVACGSGLTCVSYYGIAGPSGPLFQTCEIPCTGDPDCPTGQSCAVVADGPGQVCQPDFPAVLE